jgi:hypothetical protein
MIMTVRAGDWKVGKPAVLRTSWAKLSGIKFTKSMWKSEVVPASELVSAEVLGSESPNTGKVTGALVGGVTGSDTAHLRSRRREAAELDMHRSPTSGQGPATTKPGIEAYTKVPDQWGHHRWVYFDYDERTTRSTSGPPSAFRTAPVCPLGTCVFTKRSSIRPGEDPGEEPGAPGSGDRPNAKAGPKTWEVPIEHKRGAIELSGMMNDAVRSASPWIPAPHHEHPCDLAKRLGARVIREQKFELRTAPSSRARSS